MNRNEAQAHCILAWNLQTQAAVNIGLREVQRRSGHDLCSLLVHYRRLTLSQADQVKKAVDRAIANEQLTLKRDVSSNKKRRREPLSSALLLKKIGKTADLIKTLKMSAPDKSLNPVAKRDLAHSEPEDLASSQELQDRLGTARLDRKPIHSKPPGRQETGKSLADTTRESQNNSSSSGSFMGLTFTRFDIRGEIASGGMGVILRAFHRPSKKICALKVLFSDESNQTVFARFRREAKVLGHLDHPNIVKIIEHGCENNDPFLAMEFIIGRNLKEIVEKKYTQKNLKPEAKWATETLLPIARAIDHCHEKGAIHRDIKPRNILVESSGRPVLVDFGLVKKTNFLTTSVNASLSLPGEILGTPAYMAPEQLDAKGSHGEIMEQTDVWGFAATLFYCLTGQTPYCDESAIATYLALLTKDPRRVREVNSAIPEWLDQLCYDCLQRQADKRPTMTAVIARLEDRV
jgi:predicted Ser/Thr protein kinase